LSRFGANILCSNIQQCGKVRGITRGLNKRNKPLNFLFRKGCKMNSSLGKSEKAKKGKKKAGVATCS